MSELWDIIDINRDKTGRVLERGQPMYEGEYHLAVHIWIHNKKSEWLISKRSPEKKTAPNTWEVCGGAAVFGEDSLAAALREAKYELGISLSPHEGYLLSTIIHKNQHPPGGSCMADVWVFSHDCPIEDVILQPGETCDARWENIDVIRNMIDFSDFFREIDIAEFTTHPLL
jgi:isopentenyldiphosphate isomerase